MSNKPKNTNACNEGAGDFPEFIEDASKAVSDTIKAKALIAGGTAGLTAAGTVYSGVVAAGLSAAALSPGIVFVTFPAVGAYAAWKLAKTVTDPILTKPSSKD